MAGPANSETFSLLSSPALRTLFGLLPKRPGEFAPVETDTGRLSRTRLSIRVSISRRSMRPGVGARICFGRQLRGKTRGSSGGPTSLGVMLDRLLAWLARSSLWRFSSASFAFFARISSRRCMVPSALDHSGGHSLGCGGGWVGSEDADSVVVVGDARAGGAGWVGGGGSPSGRRSKRAKGQDSKMGDADKTPKTY